MGEKKQEKGRKKEKEKEEEERRTLSSMKKLPVHSVDGEVKM